MLGCKRYEPLRAFGFVGHDRNFRGTSIIFGLCMSIVGGYNLVKPLLSNVGLAGDVMMGAVPVETSAPLMGAVEMDFPTGGEGEMEY